MGVVGRLLMLGLLLVTIGLAACSNSAPPAAVGGVAPAGPTPSGGPTTISTPAYTLGSGDQIRVAVFRHEDLSGEFQLDGSGNFAMPLVGEIKAMGLTTRELEQRIAAKLKEGYLVDPQVSIDVKNYRPFYILGEVNRPSQYPFVNGLTALQAVTMAGGFTYRAYQDSVVLQRGGANTQGVRVPLNQPILPGDVITVEERFF